MDSFKNLGLETSSVEGFPRTLGKSCHVHRTGKPKLHMISIMQMHIAKESKKQQKTNNIVIDLKHTKLFLPILAMHQQGRRCQLSATRLFNHQFNKYIHTHICIDSYRARIFREPWRSALNMVFKWSPVLVVSLDTDFKPQCSDITNTKCWPNIDRHSL